MQHQPVESRQIRSAIRDVPTTPLITQATAARVTGLTRRQIAELVADRQLASLQVGRRRLVYRNALDVLLRDFHGAAA